MELWAATGGTKNRDDEHPKVREGLGMPESWWRVLHIPMKVNHTQPQGAPK